MGEWTPESARQGGGAAGPEVVRPVVVASGFVRRVVTTMWSRGPLAAVRSRARALAVQWVVLARTRAEAGMSTAEYAVGTIAACGFAALLWKVVSSGEVRSMLAELIRRALRLAG